MYDKWFFFFHSTKNEIMIKNTYYKVQKEYMDNGDLKISGSYPDKWYIILKPTLYESNYKKQYEHNMKKKQFESDLHMVVYNHSLQELDNMEKRYKNIQKETVSYNKNTDIEKIQNTIFDHKHKIHTNPKNISYILELEKLLQQEKELKEKKYTNDMYIIRDKSIIQNGKIPEPPTIEELQIKKYSNRKIITAYKKETENNDNDNNNNKKGGFIKVVKLL